MKKTTSTKKSTSSKPVYKSGGSVKKPLKKAQYGMEHIDKPTQAQRDSALVANIKRGIADSVNVNGVTLYPTMPKNSLEQLMEMYKRDNPGKPVYANEVPQKKRGGSVKSVPKMKSGGSVKSKKK